MAPLFTAASFPGVTRPAPVLPTGLTGTNPAGASDAVSLTLSDGSVAQVFDTLEAALRCMAYMQAQNMWLLQASDDVAVVSVSGTKLLCLEMTLVNQKMLASFLPTYIGGAVKFVHRTMSQTLSLGEALASVGFPRPGAMVYRGNFDLAQSPQPRILVVDWFFRSSTTTSTQGSQLADDTPIVYDLTP